MATFNTKQKRLILLSGLGGFLEFYDFIIYALFAVYIAANFFPAENVVTSLLATFATFSVGYLVRPIGGIVFGHFGDKFGRKKVFTITIFMMALATFAIGLVPSYKYLGIAAPIILVSLRLLQGFSVGGEIPGAITYVSESAPQSRGYACSIIFFFLVNGISLGYIVHIILNGLLTQNQIMRWGFRLPFFIGGILGLVNYFMRRQFYESPMYQEIEKNVEKFPLGTVLKNNFRMVFCGTMLVSLGACLIILLFLFTPAYLTKILHYHPTNLAWIGAICMILSTLLILFFGKMSDHINKKIPVIIISLIALIIAYPIFDMYVKHAVNIWIPMLLSVLVFGSFWGFIPIILAEYFPTKVRYSGVAVAYNLGFAIFGGLTPLVAISLIKFTHVLQSPSYYMMALAIMGIICEFALPKKQIFN